MLLILNGIGSGRRMMAHLLTDQLDFARIAIIGPVAEKELAEERVQRLLLTAQLFTAGTVLLAKSAQEPFHDQGRTLLGAGFLGRGDEQVGMFGPVGRIFDQAGGGEDKRGSGKGPEISIEGGDCLQQSKYPFG